MSLFESLSQRVDNLDSNRRYIDECLGDYGLTELRSEKFSVSYVQRIDDMEFRRSFNDFVQESAVLTEELQRIIETGAGEDRREIEKFDNHKKHERRHYWVLWGHRCVRWAMGSLLVVLVYSLLVAASESTSGYLNWVKIPIREWVIGKST